jgi:hypothetical protein
MWALQFAQTNTSVPKGMKPIQTWSHPVSEPTSGRASCLVYCSDEEAELLSGCGWLAIGEKALGRESPVHCPLIREQAFCGEYWDKSPQGRRERKLIWQF